MLFAYKSPHRKIINGFLTAVYIVVIAVISATIVSLLSGCVGIRHQTGAQKTANEPLHAERGVGLGFWKIPALSILFWGWGEGGTSSVIVHRHDEQMKPLPVPPGAPPLPPNLHGIVDYKTIYNAPLNDDPTLVIVANRDYLLASVKIDEEPAFPLGSYQATKNLFLKFGKHLVRVVVEKQTTHHGTKDLEYFFSLDIEPRGRPHLVEIYEWGVVVSTLSKIY